jgi:hypothetical protein
MIIGMSSPSPRMGSAGLALLLGLLAPPAGAIAITTMIVAIVSVAPELLTKR